MGAELGGDIEGGGVSTDLYKRRHGNPQGAANLWGSWAASLGKRATAHELRNGTTPNNTPRDRTPRRRLLPSVKQPLNQAPPQHHRPMLHLMHPVPGLEVLRRPACRRQLVRTVLAKAPFGSLRRWLLFIEFRSALDGGAIPQRY